jgi:hypothetical protein
VDDVTDFEFDIKRRSYNIVIAEIVHHGTAGQKATLKRLWDSGARPEPGTLEEFFAQPAAAALDLARREAEEGFRMWQELGFWFPARTPACSSAPSPAAPATNASARSRTRPASDGDSKSIQNHRTRLIHRSCVVLWDGQ